VCGCRPAIDAVVVERSDDGVSGPLAIVVLSLPVSVALPDTVCGMLAMRANVRTLSVVGTPVDPGAGDTKAGPSIASAGHALPPTGPTRTNFGADESPPHADSAQAAIAAASNGDSVEPRRRLIVS
jgi:hypothetical protein